MPNPNQNVVTQADRDAAEAFMDAHGWLCEKEWRDVHPGDQEVIAKAFAKHRLSASPSSGAAIPAGMKAWPDESGAMSPPDWDGKEALMSDGSFAVPVGFQWHPFGDVHVIAYTPKPTIPTEGQREVESAMLEDVVRQRKDEPEDGHWQPCSGCHETEDGYDVGHYPFSEVFQSKVGAGCGECGGLGVIWDSTDYAEMADWMIREARTYDAVKGAIRQHVRQVGDVLVGVDDATDAILALDAVEEARTALEGSSSGEKA